MWPNYALVASNLPPEEFGKHYTVGSSRYYHGQVIFAQIADDYRHEYFQIDELMKDVIPNQAGRPKRTKFIACYRVLEHIDLSAFLDLFITSVSGQVLRLKQEPYERVHQPGFIRTYQEVCPFSAIVMSHMAPPEFGEYITDLSLPKSAPEVMFTQIDFVIEDFLKQLEANPFHTSPIPNVHPHKLKEQILELQGKPEKSTKAISLDSVLGRISFLQLRTGFWIAAQEREIFYPIPDKTTLESSHPDFYRSIVG